MSTLELFTSDTWSVRAGLHDDEPVFVARDVCDALDIAKPRDAVARLDDDERVSMIVDTLGGPQSMTAVTEPGLYRLVMAGRTENAKVFRRWVTHDVLPAIRRTGTYTVAAPAPVAEMPTHVEALRGWADAIERAERAETENAVLAPKAALADDLLSAEGDLSVREAAQALSSRAGVDIGAGRLRDYLRDIGWIDKRRIAPLPLQAQINCGRLAVKIEVNVDRFGVEHISRQIRVTPKGLGELHKRLSAPRLALVAGGAS